jgi:DNA helicase-2/ATP-dependent DNA helicase PcrA
MEDIPEEFLFRTEFSGSGGFSPIVKETGGFGNPKRLNQTAQGIFDPSNTFSTSDGPSTLFKVGVRVRHPVWGEGIIRRSDGPVGDQRVSVDFPRVGVKRLAINVARLERVSG